MSHKYIAFKPIGIIHTKFKDKVNVPIQPCFSNTKAKVEVFQKFSDGLKDLDGFSHIVLIYCFHKSTNYNLHVKPFLDNKKRGVFATRAPKRPNPIGMSVVELENIKDNILYIKKGVNKIKIISFYKFISCYC
jgi:tRNA (adenine37-N6)-methyltransferase